MYQEGQSLVEMIVVIGVVILLVTGIVSVTTASLGRSTTVQSRAAALLYAQEGIELARTQRDSGWDAFALLGTAGSASCPGTACVFCVGSDNQFTFTPTACTTNIQSTYTRTITLSLIPASGPDVEKMSVTSHVAWGNTQNPSNFTELVTYLTQWR